VLCWLLQIGSYQKTITNLQQQSRAQQRQILVRRL
jgi:hypothetical protein